MTTREELVVYVVEQDGEDSPVALADGFEGAFLGLAEVFNCVIAVYDYDKCIEILTRRDKMTEDDAVEHMSFNVTGTYIGPHTPAFLKLADKQGQESP